jgi:choline dehydrogenase-like flavoprotein
LIQCQEDFIFFDSYGALPVYWFDYKIVKALQRSSEILVEAFLKAGAKKVFTPIRGFESVSNFKELELLKKSRLKAWHFLALSAHHPLGTCQMGDNQTNSVVDRNGKVWGKENLYVVDGSAIPGPLGANPQVTIMANALRVARLAGQTL